MGKYSRTLKDYNDEISTVQVYATDLNETNIAAQITLQANFGAAINDLSIGSLQKIEYGNQVISNSPAPTNTWAQRELKWRIDYVDDVTGKPGYFTIPCANTALLDPNNKGMIDPDHADVVDFIAAMEAYVLSQDGNAVSFVQGVLVGRNI